MAYTVSFKVQVIDGDTPSAPVVGELGYVMLTCPNQGTAGPSRLRYTTLTSVITGRIYLESQNFIAENSPIVCPVLVGTPINSSILSVFETFQRRSGFDVPAILSYSDYTTLTGNLHIKILNNSGYSMICSAKINDGAYTYTFSWKHYNSSGTLLYTSNVGGSGMGAGSSGKGMNLVVPIPIAHQNADGSLYTVTGEFNVIGYNITQSSQTYDICTAPPGAQADAFWSNCVFSEPDDPFEEGGTSGAGGGTGTFSDTGDSIAIPNVPTLSAVSTGFITLFAPSVSELQALANYMWGSLDLDNWRKIFADPMDAILGLSIVPVAVPTAGAVAVTVGNISTGVAMTKAASQYVQVDCGSLSIPEYWGAYLDYSPYTSLELYLPYCGTHPVDTNELMGKTIHIVYNVDILSGACCAFVSAGGTVLYSFVGHCSANVPVASTDYGTMINGAISVATSIGTMVASGGATAPVAVPQLVSTAVNGLKPQVEKSGAMAGTGGMLGVQTPYLILTRPRQALPEAQAGFTGYPSFITRQVSQLKGYTEVEKIHLDNVSATSSEIEELNTLLSSGVIFPF